MKAKVTLYQERTSAGLLASLVLHDSGINLQQHLRIINSAKAKPCGASIHSEVLDLMGGVIPQIVTGYELLRGASRSGGHRVSEFDGGETIGSIVSQFEKATARELKIHYEKAPTPLRMRESDLWSILVNLLHNAVTSDEFKHARNRSFPPEREIVVATRVTGGDLEVLVEDNGPGLPEKPPEWMWQRGNSDRDGGGSGLGLWIISDLLANYGGFATASASTRFASGAAFRIIIPGVSK